MGESVDVPSEGLQIHDSFVKQRKCPGLGFFIGHSRSPPPFAEYPNSTRRKMNRERGTSPLSDSILSQRVIGIVIVMLRVFFILALETLLLR